MTMKIGCCCSQPIAPRRQSTLRHRLAGCLATAVLLMMPKCPACLAAYLAAATGLSLSLTTATHMRWGLYLMCGITLASLIYLKLLRREPRQTPVS